MGKRVHQNADYIFLVKTIRIVLYYTLLFTFISTSSLNGTAHRSTTGIYRFL